MFFVTILSIWAAMHVYAFWRVASIAVFAHVPRWVLAVAAVFLWSSFLLSRFAERFGAERLSEALEVVGANWIGFLFLVVVCFLAADVVTGFGYLAPHVAPAVRGWALIAGAVLCIIAVVQGWRAPVLQSYEIELRNLPAERDGTVLVAASDLHVGGIRGDHWLSARIDEINAQHPDLIVLAGDIVEGHVPAEPQIVNDFRRLSAPLGVWAVNGNHETYGVRGEDTPVLEKAGIGVLRDRWAELAPGVVLAGVDDLTTRRRRGEAGAPFIERALASRPAKSATIFLSHSPMLPERAAQLGAGLMISGHTHGGQIWPFGYIVRQFYPLLAGRYNVDGMAVVVCRGTGTWGPQMRLWSRGELLRITLRSPAKRPA